MAAAVPASSPVLPCSKCNCKGYKKHSAKSSKKSSKKSQGAKCVCKHPESSHVPALTDTEKLKKVFLEELSDREPEVAEYLAESYDMEIQEKAKNGNVPEEVHVVVLKELISNDDRVEKMVERLKKQNLIGAVTDDAKVPEQQGDMPTLNGKQVVRLEDHGQALLTEDNAWHPVKVVELLGNDRYKVVFTEYGKPQEVSREDLVLDSEVYEDADEEGHCEMCQRFMKLTRHHLIPRFVHARYKKAKGYTDEFLNTCALICRPCHNAVHRFADNVTLAEKYNTMELLLAQEEIQKYAKWASKQTKRKR